MAQRGEVAGDIEQVETVGDSLVDAASAHGQRALMLRDETDRALFEELSSPRMHADTGAGGQQRQVDKSVNIGLEVTQIGSGDRSWIISQYVGEIVQTHRRSRNGDLVE